MINDVTADIVAGSRANLRFYIFRSVHFIIRQRIVSWIRLDHFVDIFALKIWRNEFEQ